MPSAVLSDLLGQSWKQKMLGFSSCFRVTPCGVCLSVLHLKRIKWSKSYTQGVSGIQVCRGGGSVKAFLRLETLLKQCLASAFAVEVDQAQTKLLCTHTLPFLNERNNCSVSLPNILALEMCTASPCSPASTFSALKTGNGFSLITQLCSSLLLTAEVSLSSKTAEGRGGRAIAVSSGTRLWEKRTSLYYG